MRSFACPHCSALIFFENSVCLNCNTPIGYVRERAGFVQLVEQPDGGLAFRDPAGRLLVPCGNLSIAACNWLADAEAAAGLCTSCALTGTRPADAAHVPEFAVAESAKRRLLYQLDDLVLPTTPKYVEPDGGLSFDLLSSANEPVITGHDHGVITIDLAEGDDPHREAVRESLGEPYRTMLGHLRHEIGHWYWEVLIERSDPATGLLDSFHELFGDENIDYAAALEQHYGKDDDGSWHADYVSFYAASHPWEDWAECFAHYLHMTSTLQTASSYGVSVSGPDLDVPAATSPSVASPPRESYQDFDALINAWLSLTYALNAVNRSMGKEDLYPFVLVPPVLSKLKFVHRVVTRTG